MRSNKINRAAAMCLPLFFVSLMVCSFTGCGSEFSLADVTGTVTMDGEPAGGAGVRFAPASGERASTGNADEAGKYRLIFNPENLGATIGRNTVTVQYQGRILTKEVEVENSGSVTIDLELSDFEAGQ